MPLGHEGLSCQYLRVYQSAHILHNISSDRAVERVSRRGVHIGTSHTGRSKLEAELLRWVPPVTSQPAPSLGETLGALALPRSRGCLAQAINALTLQINPPGMRLTRADFIKLTTGAGVCRTYVNGVCARNPCSSCTWTSTPCWLQPTTSPRRSRTGGRNAPRHDGDESDRLHCSANSVNGGPSANVRDQRSPPGHAASSHPGPFASQ